MEKSNVILIGMPSCGKTTIGKMLSTSMKKNFVDTDLLLEKSTKLSPKEMVILHGEEFFLKTQEKLLLTINFSNTVVSTGGSVVYSKKLMHKFGICGLIIYLKNSFDELINRLDKDRRIIGSTNNSFEDLYKQRNILYTKYAHKTVNCSGLDVIDVVKIIETEVI